MTDAIFRNIMSPIIEVRILPTRFHNAGQGVSVEQLLAGQWSIPNQSQPKRRSETCWGTLYVLAHIFMSLLSVAKYAHLVLESELSGITQLVEGGIAGELQHGRRAAHQHDVVLGRGEQALLNHGGVHATRAVQRYAKEWAQLR